MWVSRSDRAHTNKEKHMNPVRKAVVGAMMVGTALTGGAVGAALVNTSATAQTATTTAPATSSTDNAATATRPAFDPSKGGHVGANGTTEALLTGDTADKVKAAAQAAVPGGTIERVENDAEGSPYEAHMTKADGTHVTVKVDAGFKVTGIEDGPGH
jgi:uncharacterized membrane protein YkoI